MRLTYWSQVEKRFSIRGSGWRRRSARLSPNTTYNSCLSPGASSICSLGIAYIAFFTWNIQAQESPFSQGTFTLAQWTEPESQNKLHVICSESVSRPCSSDTNFISQIFILRNENGGTSQLLGHGIFWCEWMESRPWIYNDRLLYQRI